MNRLFSILLVLALCLSATGCVRQAATLAPAGPEVVTDEISSTRDAPPPVPAAETPPTPAAEPEPEGTATAPEPETAPEEPYIRVIDPSKPMVALTFDDGPHAVYSHQILDILEEHHAVATFFEIGRNIPRCPDALTRMLELGCELGNHSNAHRNLGKLKKSTILKDLAAADDAFIAATGEAPTLMRPPYGSVNKTVKSDTGRAVVTWSVDTQDWLVKDADRIVQQLQGLPSLDGEVILLHSIYGSTVEAVEVLVPWLIEQGYQLVTVTEMMAYYYGVLPESGTFYGYTYFSTHSRTDTPLALPAPAAEEGVEDAAEETPAWTPTPAPENPGADNQTAPPSDSGMVPPTAARP